MPDDPRARQRAQRSWRRRVTAVALIVLPVLAVSGCSWVRSWFDDDEPTEAISVLSLQPGMCLVPPTDPAVELTTISQVPCEQPHTQEVYSVRPYAEPGAAGGNGADAAVVLGDDTPYPGEAALTTFADGVCAEDFTGYVGVSYTDSSLWYTYLMPSARAWEQRADRSVVCVVLTNGAPLTASVAGSRL